MSVCQGLKADGECCQVVCKGDFKGDYYCYAHIVQGKKCCCVCYEQVKCVKIGCGHNICNDCIYSWYLKRHISCPTCRQVYSKETETELDRIGIERKDYYKVTILYLNMVPDQIKLLRKQGIEFDFARPKTKDEAKAIFAQIDHSFLEHSRYEDKFLRCECGSTCPDCEIWKSQPEKNCTFLRWTPEFKEQYMSSLPRPPLDTTPAPRSSDLITMALEYYQRSNLFGV